MPVDYIVARYRENVGWLEELKNRSRTYTYNKFHHQPISITNVGREIQTFVYHIYYKYDVLEELNVFLQGNPLDHCQGELLWILNDIENVMDGKNFLDLGSRVLIESNKGQVCEPPLKIHQYYQEVFQTHEVPKYFRFTVGANSVIRRSAIHKRPKEFYLRILEIFDRDGDLPAWSIERFWSQIYE